MPHGRTVPCLHCSTVRCARRVAGLCPRCASDPRIARQYPADGARPRRRRRPPFATTAPPGSPAKVEVLAWRLEHGFTLWHPADGPGA